MSYYTSVNLFNLSELSHFFTVESLFYNQSSTNLFALLLSQSISELLYFFLHCQKKNPVATLLHSLLYCNNYNHMITFLIIYLFSVNTFTPIERCAIIFVIAQAEKLLIGQKLQNCARCNSSLIGQ